MRVLLIGLTILLFVSAVFFRIESQVSSANNKDSTASQGSNEQPFEQINQQKGELLKGGALISLNIQDARFNELIRLFQEKTGLNIMASDKVGGSFSAHVKDVPAREALRSLLEVNNLYYIEKKTDNLVHVVTRLEYEKYASLNLLQEKVFRIHLSDSTLVMQALKPLMTKGISRIINDTRNNTLIVMDLPDRLEKIESVIKAFTAVPEQIQIEVHIVDKDYEDSWEFGIDWQLLNVPKVIDTLKTQFIPRDANDPNLGSSKGLSIFRAEGLPNENGNLEVLIHMLAGEQNINTIATPKIVTQQNKKAMIHVGSQIPYNETTTQGITGTQSSSFKFIDTGTKLGVTPRVTETGEIQMDLEIEISSSPRMIEFGQNGAFGKAPEKISTTITTSVLVKNKDILILGGLIRSETNIEVQGIPILKDIPLLKYLFSYRKSSEKKKDTWIYIRPRLIKGSDFKISPEHKKLIENSENR